MLQYRTPGVYFEWLDKRAPAIVPLRTDIAGFVGIAASGPLHVPVKIESFTQFTSTFGDHIPQGYLAYAVEGFFANGGQTCWVVRVADAATARPAVFDLLDENDPPNRTLRLKAISRITRRDERGRPSFETYDNPGTAGENITFTLSSTARDRFSLIIRLGNAQEIWRDLSLRSDDRRYVEKIVNDKANGSNLVEAKVLVSSSRAPLNTPNRLARNLHGGVGRLVNGTDGLKNLTADQFAGVLSSGSRTELQGLATLELIDEISIVAIPDIMPKSIVTPPPPKTPPHDCSKLDRADFEALYKEEPWPTLECCLPTIEPDPPDKENRELEFPPRFEKEQILFLQSALVAHCEKLKDRVAVLDTPLLDPTSKIELTPELALAWRKNFDTKYGAIYFPWLRVPDVLNLEGILRSVPPSGHIAGIYARGDRRVGVHKPPANEELEGVKDVEVTLEDVDHGALNDNGINVIRPYRGRGVRVAGARTLTKLTNPEFRFLNIRRLLIMIEEAIDEQTQWTVFEPNNHDLWRDIERVARSFLDTIWRLGMLDGATPEEAFFVRCDETTNPEAEIDLGRVTCEIGLLPPWPAEFVIVRIGKTEGGTEIIEGAG